MPRIDPARWHELSPFLDQALELSDGERAAWLEALRTEQPALADDLQRLLEELQVLGQEGFLEGGASKLLKPSLEGQRIGAYTLESLIGEGGMGSVWRARRSDGQFEGWVAVKLLNVALMGHGGEERFRREGRVLAKLTHPNIARIIDAGLTAAAQPYLVLEFVEGGSIDRHCDEHSLSIEARVNLFLDVLAAVGHAHANLIVHRDIKPSNIYVGRDGLVKLLDFGIAKLIEVDELSNAATNLTRDGVLALTPDYAAPEQVLGEPVTIATDVYALGVLMYLLLCGQHPTREKDTSPHQHIRLLLESEPPRLSEAAAGSRGRDLATFEEGAAKRGTTPAKLRRLLRGDLDNIAAKALKKNPQERYASVREFADDLRRYLRNEPVLARADNPWYRVRKFVVRNRLPVAIGSVALMAVLATAAIALSEARSVTAERDRALAMSARNEAVADFLNMLVTDAASPDRPVTIREMLTRSEALVRVQYRDNPEHRAAVFDMLGMYYAGNDEHARAETLLREALATVEASADADLRRKLICDHALTLANLGKVSEAIPMLQEVIDEPQITLRQSAECLDSLTVTEVMGNDAANALKFGTLALEQLHRVTHPSPVMEANLLADLGYAQHLNDRNDVADGFFARALALFAQVGRDRGFDANSVRNSWALVNQGAGNPRRALELYEEALNVVAQNESGAAVHSPLVYNKARTLELLGRFRNATEAYTQCVALAERDGASLPRVYCLLGLASVSREAGDMSSADRYLASMSAIVGAPIPAGYPAAPRIQTLRGEIALTEGRLGEARANLDAAITESKTAFATTDALEARAELNLQEGKVALAEADARRALALAQAAQGGIQYSNRTGLAWLCVGRVLAKQADAVQARKAFQAAVDNLSNTVDADHPMLLRARELARE